MKETTKDCRFSGVSRVAGVLALAAALTLVGPARGAKVMDLGRLKGSEANTLVGMGLVVGLNGTGDGGKFAPTVRPLRELIASLMDSNVMEVELKDSKNVALVALEATVPASGAREGDFLDVRISSIGAAKSLRGGRLFPIPLVFPHRDSPVVAVASGPVEIVDPASPQVAVIRGSAATGQGAKLAVDTMRSVLLDEFGRMTFVLGDRYATWTIANNLANLINDVVSPEGPRLARAADAKNIVIEMPRDQRGDPATFVSQILSTPVDPAHLETGARVLTNRAKAMVILTDDVQISPVVISIRGYRITTQTPPLEPTPQNPQEHEKRFLGLDPLNRGGQRLSDLINALQQLKVTNEEIVDIVTELHAMGAIHANLIPH